MNWNDNCNDVDFNLNFDFCWRRCLRYSDKLCVAVPAIRKMRTSEGCFVQTNEHLKWKKQENGHFITFKKVGKWAFDMRAPLNLAAMSRFSISWNPFIWECCKGSRFGRKQKRRVCYSRCKERPPLFIKICNEKPENSHSWQGRKKLAWWTIHEKMCPN